MRQLQSYAKALQAIHEHGYKITYKSRAHFLEKGDNMFMLWDKSAVCMFANTLYEKSLRHP